MGGRGKGTRKHLFFCVVFLVFLSVSGCAFQRSSPQELSTSPQEGANEHLARAGSLLVQHSYETALQEYQTVLTVSDGKPPGDQALLFIGQIYSDPQNQKRDFSKSIASLQRLVREYPRSPWADTARVWMENLKEQERLKRVMVDSIQENERLRRVWNEGLQENERLKRVSNETLQENARLKRIVEESKTVDVEIDEKKRNQTK